MALRILHVATRHRLGGAERNLLHTVARELERGYEVHVAVGTDGLRRDFPPRSRLHPLPDLIRDVSAAADRRALDSLRALIGANRFDVVHTHQSKAGVLGRIAARGIVPVLIHTVHMASFGPAYGRFRSAAFFGLERWMTSFTDMFVFVGADLQQRYLAAGVGAPSRCAVIHSPVTELESLLTLRGMRGDERERARIQIGVPEGRQAVLMVAALDARKRHDVAIRALAPMLAQDKAHLVIAGHGPERERLERLCERLGVARAVHFAGFIRDVRPLYAAADLLVHTSALEGVPQAVVQAIAAGLPVVATEVDGLREVAPDPRHMSVLPPDGRGLLELVRARLEVHPARPAPAETLRPWLPETVNRDLGRLHDWMESRTSSARGSVAGRVQPPRSPARLWGMPRPAPVAMASEELATR